MPRLDQIPDTEHWAIVTQSDQTIYTPGDERSRTNPGHGYPAGYETISSLNYDAFSTEKDLIDRLKYLQASYPNRTYRVIKVQPAQIETTVSIKVK